MKKYQKYAVKLTNKSKFKPNADTEEINLLPSKAQKRPVYSTIDENFGFLNSIISSTIGLTETKYELWNGKTHIGVAYIQSLADKELISSHIIKPLIEGNVNDAITADIIPDLIRTRFIHIPDTKKSNMMEEVIRSLYDGFTVIFSEDSNETVLVGCKKIEKRSIEMPNNEVTVLASMDSFTEDLETNCSLIIRRLPTPDLHFEEFTAGRLSHTKIKVVWLEGIAHQIVIDEIKKRIEKIDVDNIDGIGPLIELIVEEPLSIFPNYRQTQRPDTVTRKLSDGYVAVFCSNSPFALVAPMFFTDNFKTMDDYSENFYIGSFLRFVRLLAFFLSTTVCSLYVAFVAYNQTIVPPPLAVTIASGRNSVPFPTIIEILFLSLTITIIREASLRLPGSVGYFIGTLAAVVIGQSAVTGGYVSASVIIVIAISAISSYAISNSNFVYPARLLNYVMILLAGMFGMFGVVNGIVLIIWHMVSLKSFGMPYLYPIVPFDKEAIKDSFIRAPFKYLKNRPGILAHDNNQKVGARGKNVK